MTKAIFIDIDGTLVDQQSQVPASAAKAIQSARGKGHKVFICTGRSNPEILPEIRAVGFAGVIGAGGAYIEIDDEVVLHEMLPEKTVKKLIELFEREKIGCYFETNNGLYKNEYCVDMIHHNVLKNVPEIEEMQQEALKKVTWFTKLLKDPVEGDLDFSEINKICFINESYPYDKIDEEFGEQVELHHSTMAEHGDNSGEAGVKGHDKKAAVEFVLDKLNLAKEDAVAFGDGDNDIAMFDAVGFKVAMENGTDKLKSHADAITATPENDGLAKAFEKYNLI